MNVFINFKACYRYYGWTVFIWAWWDQFCNLFVCSNFFQLSTSLKISLFSILSSIVSLSNFWFLMYVLSHIYVCVFVCQLIFKVNFCPHWDLNLNVPQTLPNLLPLEPGFKGPTYVSSVHLFSVTFKGKLVGRNTITDETIPSQKNDSLRLLGKGKEVGRNRKSPIWFSTENTKENKI